MPFKRRPWWAKSEGGVKVNIKILQHLLTTPSIAQHSCIEAITRGDRDDVDHKHNQAVIEKQPNTKLIYSISVVIT